MHFALSNVSQLACLGQVPRKRSEMETCWQRFLALKSTSSQGVQEAGSGRGRIGLQCSRYGGGLSQSHRELRAELALQSCLTLDQGSGPFCKPHSQPPPQGGVTGYRQPPGLTWAG